MDYVRFWDIAPVVYLIGVVIAFVLLHERLSKPECYRIPFALIIAMFWPLVLLLCLVLYIEGLIHDLRAWIFERFDK